MLANVHPNVLIFLLGSVALVVLPHAWNIAPVIIAYFYALWLWRLLCVWKKHWLPNKFVLFLLTCGGFLLLYSQHQGIFGRDAGTSVIITALALKLLEIKTVRDLYLIVYLAFIVAVTLFLYRQSIVLAVYIVFVCVSLLATLVVLNGRVTAPVALKIAGILLLQALPFGIALFMLFPRLEAPHWMFLQDKHKAKSGLSEILEPGAISDLGLSDELVFRVKFIGAIPPQAQRYWRGLVYSYTDGKKWLPPIRQSYLQAQHKLAVRGESYQYTVLMEPQDKAWVFALEMPVLISYPLKLTPDYQLKSTTNTQVRSEYVLRSYPNYSTGDISSVEFQENTQLPGSASVQIKTLVEKLKGFDSSPEVFIQQVLKHFKTEQFYYTLTPPALDENPIETFLFETRTGFCSHYATAFVYLMRVAHIPARVIGGYQGGELNKVGSFLEIRQADAHAWAEVWLTGKGWTRIDPTAAVAPERIEQGVNIDLQIASGLVNFSAIDLGSQGDRIVNFYKQFRQAWQAADYQWQRWVINYNTEHQTNFLSSLGLQDVYTMLQWLFAIMSVLTLGLFAWLMKQPKKPKDLALYWYEKFCVKLAKANLVKLPSETASAFAVRVNKSYPNLTGRVNEITELYLKIRYGKSFESSDLKYMAQRITALNIKKLINPP